MPRVQKYPGAQVGPNALPSIRPLPAANLPGSNVPDATEESLGAGIGSTLSRVESAFHAKALELHERELLKADEASAQDAEGKLLALSTSLEFDPKTGFRTVKGKAAGGLNATVTEGFDTGSAEIEKGLTSDRQREMFARVRASHAATLNRKVDEYSFGEIQRFDDEGQQAVTVNAANAAVKSASIGDLAGVKFGLDTAMSSAAAYSARKGESPEAAQLRAGTIRSAIHAEAIDAMLAGGRDVMARDYFARVQPEITVNAAAVQAKLNVANIEGDGQRAADVIWKASGPKADGDPVELDKMAEAARAQYPDDAKRQKATIDGLKERKAEFDASVIDRNANTESAVWKAVLAGAAPSDLMKMPEFLSLPGAKQNEIKAHTEDKAYQLQQRGRGDINWLWSQQQHEQSEDDRAYTLGRRARQSKEDAEQDKTKAGYAQFWKLSNLETLDKMSEAQIANQVGTLGVPLTNALMEKKRAIVKGEGKTFPSTIDDDLFKQAANSAGLKPYAKASELTESDQAKLGALQNHVLGIISAEQQAKGRQLTREEKQSIMQTEIDKKVMLATPGFFYGQNTTGPFPAGAVPQGQTNTMVPITQIPPASQTTLSNLATGWGAKMTPDKMQRAYAAALAGDNARLEAILKEK